MCLHATSSGLAAGRLAGWQQCTALRRGSPRVVVTVSSVDEDQKDAAPVLELTLSAESIQ